MDLVSIIIPIYNVEDYLDRCISSVTAQSYTNLEIILVNDGSSDNSGAICEKWAENDPRIRVLHWANGGVSAARNAGLSAAKGSWIIQLDSDDYLSPVAVDHLLRTAETTGTDMVICDFVKGSEETYPFGDVPLAQAQIVDGVTAVRHIYADDHNALRYAVPWCRLCHRRLYEGVRYPTGKIFEDIYTTHKLLYRCNRIAILDEPLFYYYQRPGSIMNTSFSMKKLDYLQALVERVKFFGSHDLKDLKQIAYDELLHSLIWEYSRTRDVLQSREGMDYVITLFRQVYQKGYASQRYPEETAAFLAVFNCNPEWIIMYWKIAGKLKKIMKRNG